MEKRVDLKLILAIVAAGLLSFCGVIVETAMNITFPKLMREFALNTATVQWMTTAYLLVVAIIVPISAFLKRRFRTKTLFVTANLLFILGLVVDAAATSFPVLVTGRIIQGMGTGIALPLMFNIIIDWAPARQKGTLMGIGTLITAIAPALGPTFGGLIVSWMDWHWIFVLLIPVLVISLVLGLYAIRQAQPTVKVGFDVVGWLMIVLLFVGFTIGFSKLATITTQPLIFGSNLCPRVGFHIAQLHPVSERQECFVSWLVCTTWRGDRGCFCPTRWTDSRQSGCSQTSPNGFNNFGYCHGTVYGVGDAPVRRFDFSHLHFINDWYWLNHG